PLELAEVFPRAQPIEVDLGSGPGQFLVGAAQYYPERNFLGVERLLGRVRKSRRKAHNLGLQNVRVLRSEIDYTVRHLLPAGSIRRFHLSFPDPWPKRRHHRRRLIDLGFFEAAYDSLDSGGDLWIRTDHTDYFNFIQKLVPATRFITSEWSDEFYPTTDFEDLFQEKQLPVYRLRLTKTRL
ncbi:MAG TPA: tRNA (guanosine(46)-N7)-methyltransferase TrmB, partial [Chthoniobacterales bacterium]